MKTAYELWFSEDSILDPIETQMCIASAITCSGAPVQAMWHTRGIVRHGGTKEQAEFAQQIALQVADKFNSATGQVTLVEGIDWDDDKAA